MYSIPIYKVALVRDGAIKTEDRPIIRSADHGESSFYRLGSGH